MEQVIQPAQEETSPINLAQLSTLSASKELPQPDFDQGEGILSIDLLNEILLYCLENKCEDLILMSGRPWAVMWSSRVVMLGKWPITTAQLELLANRMTGNDNASIQIGTQAQPWDGAYTLRHKTRLARGVRVRFRVSITGCLSADGQAGLEFVIRPAGKVPPTLKDLGVPQLLYDNCMPESGIVLVTGPTGSGKTTLLDSIVRELATGENGKHILTYYQPIENDLNQIPNITGIISQGQVGKPGQGGHLPSFPEAVANALRRHPHAVVVGEARDRETIEGAVTLAMTGHATYTTTHTSSVEMTIPRMADSFPQDRERITNAMIDNTRLIVHQRLVKTPNGIGRFPIMSMLAFTQELRTDLLRLSNIDMLSSALYEAQQDPSIGLALYDDTLAKFEAGKIHEDAMLGIERERAARK